ncbi:hypothetical protein E4U13_008098 [Claviceps humidiphila]|uniref:Uncharacterized protein n=1 Tax=Claviceps humidiphila TaxID=1294629 RepID=A0A9P7PXU6_9HYPO|nr:hypothetical protein E4U13_008098 [Claviceps humidiphila]
MTVEVNPTVDEKSQLARETHTDEDEKKTRTADGQKPASAMKSSLSETRWQEQARIPSEPEQQTQSRGMSNAKSQGPRNSTTN